MPPGMKHRSVNVAPGSPASPPKASPVAPLGAAAAASPPSATASTPSPESASPPSHGAGAPSLLDVSILVARGGWLDLSSGKHLQEASGTLCRDCREYVGSHLRVDYSTPRVLWPLRTAGVIVFGRSGGGGGGGRTLGGGGNGKGGGGRGILTRLQGKENAGAGGDNGRAARGKEGWVTSSSRPQQGGKGSGPSIPPLRVTMMTWERPLSDLAHGRALPPGLQSLYFACSFRYFDVDWVSFPSSLLSLSFPQNFDQTIEGVAWPASLQRLTFGWEFNQVRRRGGVRRVVDGRTWVVDGSRPVVLSRSRAWWNLRPPPLARAVQLCFAVFGWQKRNLHGVFLRSLSATACSPHRPARHLEDEPTPLTSYDSTAHLLWPGLIGCACS